MNRLLQKQGVLILAFILNFPFIFLGYGTDNDTFVLLDNGRSFVNTGSYVPSRNPGYLVHEAATLILSSIGGSVLSNAGTMFMSLLFISSFLKVCSYFSIPNKNLLAILLTIHPLILINSTETIDYLWALGLLFAGFELMLKFRYFFAAILFGLAIGARLSSFIAIGCILCYAFFLRKDDASAQSKKHFYLSIVVTAIVGILCYLPSINHSHWTLDFLKPHMPDNDAWSFKSRVGKLVYKNVYFWGLPAFILMIPVLYLTYKNRSYLFAKQWVNLSIMSLAVIVGYELLFLKFPVQTEYLIPILPFVLFLVGIGLKNNYRIIVALIISVAAYNVVNFNLAKANVQREATGAKFGFWVESGLLLRETQLRIKFKNCASGDCWAKVFTAEYSK